MWDNLAKYRVLKVFFDDPLTQDFQLREISRKAKLAPLSVKRYLLELEKEKLIVRREHRANNYPVYAANRDEDVFKRAKKLDNVRRLYQCGLVDHLDSLTLPNCIVLFGSQVRGEDTAESDIDLFLESEEALPELEKYERILNRKISLHYLEDFGKLQEGLKSNILNGIVLKGYINPYGPHRAKQKAGIGADKDGAKHG
jgi:predicted nucleotidyltransferase